MIKTFEPVMFTYKAASNAIVGRILLANKQLVAQIELKDGQVLLQTREYQNSNLVSQAIYLGVEKGQELDIIIGLSSRGLLIVEVNNEVSVSQLNWPSYRGEQMTFKAGKTKAEPVEKQAE